MKRREFFGLAAVPAIAAPLDVGGIKSRGAKKVEIAYKSPHRIGLRVRDEATG